MSEDQALGAFIFTVCVAVTTAYTVALCWSALEAIRLWLVAIPVLNPQRAHALLTSDRRQLPNLIS